MEKQLTITQALKVLKPANEVFEAIVNPDQMSNYFISESTGRMEQGKTVTWKFPEFDMRFPVRVDKIKPNEFISYRWDDMEGGETKVEIRLEPKNNNETFIRITEGTKPADDKGIEWYGRNSGGWANFLACLKAWMEYGVHLRKGAFDASQMPE